MKIIAIRIAVKILRFVNLIFYPFTLQEKVVIISRQSDVPTLDIRLLGERLKKNEIKTVVLTKMLRNNLGGMISYGFQMLRQMYHLATSKVVVLDGYCILVSILPKKKGQQVIQMWHALGAIKKFGWQTIDNPDGSSAEIAEAMKMHRNYDYVMAPGKVTGKIFAEAFRVPEEKMLYIGLPRIDFIREQDEAANKRMEQAYPGLNDKIKVLYVPTFRKNAALDLKKLVDGFDFDKFHLVVKKHFLDKGDYSWAKEAGAIVDEQFTSLEWLRICEKVVTDYSAMAFEAAILDRELYIYQPDVQAYEQNVGINVDLEEEAIAAYVCKSEEALYVKLAQPYNQSDILAFRQKYLEINLDHCTQELCDFIKTLLSV